MRFAARLSRASAPTLAALLVVCLLLTASAHAQTSPVPATPAVQRIEKHLAVGVDLIQEITPLRAPGGPLIITVIRVDPRVPGVRLESALGQDRVWNTDPTFGREIVSALVTRHKAVAGVNAGFFPFAGNPLGLHIGSGNLVTEPGKQHRTSFYVTKEGKTGFAGYRFAAQVRVGDDPTAAHAIDGLNRKPGGIADGAGELLLFTPIWSPQTLPIAGRVELVVNGVSAENLTANRDYVGAIGAVTTGGSTPIAPNTVVLSGIGPAAEFLRAAAIRPGATISFRVDILPDPTPATSHANDPDASTLAQVVTGGPRVLADGVFIDHLKAESFGKDFSTTGHPRTAVGRTADGVILLVTVDGRQKDMSHGAPLPDLAAILKRLGAVDGLNLDGGGSSTAVVWDGVANSPSEGIERPIADALLVYADDIPASDSDVALPELIAPDHPLKVGETWNFARPGLAASDHAVWGTKGGVGFVSQTGVFHALRKGKGSVLVTLGSRSRVARVSFVVEGVSRNDAAGFAPILTLLPIDPSAPLRQVLAVHIANAEGDPLSSEPVDVDIVGGVPDMPTVTTDVHGDTRVTIAWAAALSAAAPRSVAVTSPRKRFDAGKLTVGTAAP